MHLITRTTVHVSCLHIYVTVFFFNIVCGFLLDHCVSLIIIIIIIIIVVSDLNKTKQNGTVIIQHVKPKWRPPIISRNLKSYTLAF